AGVTHLAQEAPEVQVRLVKRLVLHEDYDDVSQKNDVALVELEEPAGCGPFVQPVCVPDPSLSLSAMTKCYVSGWGTTSSRGERPRGHAA
ncbi:ACRO protein, partial [Piaya cayana]|nr:ACRO protein [Piaya cayana]